MAATTGADYRLRIFTPEVELPFAGHPRSAPPGCWPSAGELAPGEVVQSCGAGELRCRCPPDGGPVTLTGGHADGRAADRPDALLRAVGLSARDLIGVEPRSCGTGLEFGYLLVRPGAVARCGPDPRACARSASPGCRSSPGTARPRTPGSSPAGVGVAEDPATGSAALGLGVYLVATGLLADGGSYVVRQGAELGRPSRLDCTVAAVHGAAVAASVTGSVVPMAVGRIRRPDVGRLPGGQPEHDALLGPAEVRSGGRVEPLGAEQREHLGPQLRARPDRRDVGRPAHDHARLGRLAADDDHRLVPGGHRQRLLLAAAEDVGAAVVPQVPDQRRRLARAAQPERRPSAGSPRRSGWASVRPQRG
jgi:trans-2,3-dihydro-3-hydroxyanthranilate isomerase